MNQKKLMNSRKLRYGGVSTALTALIITVVILINIIVSALGSKLLWYTDLTPELLFTLTPSFTDLMSKGEAERKTESPLAMIDKMRQENQAYNKEHGLTPGSEGYKDENLGIKIIFCDTKEAWETENTLLLYVYQTAQQLAKEFDGYFTVENVDSVKNKSYFKPYTLNNETISSTDVIIACGGEYRIRSLDQFYQTTSGENQPWAYKGEIIFASVFLAITRAQNPLVCFTVGHGEDGYVESSYLYQHLVEEAGFDAKTIDLTTEQIPEECRLIITLNPQFDFKTPYNSHSTEDELEKLDAFLAKEDGRSLMVFMSPDVAPLTFLEEYLAEWGIAFERNSAGVSYVVEDSSNTSQSDVTGKSVLAQYVRKTPISSLFEGLTSIGSDPDTMFYNAMPIKYADGFTMSVYPAPGEKADDGLEFTYGAGTVDMQTREIYTIFETSENAVAKAGGIIEEQNRAFPLMTVSVRPRQEQTGDSLLMEGMDILDTSSYVYACGSVDFVSDNNLTNRVYANREIMLSACKIAGEVEVAHGLRLNPFQELAISTITTKAAWTYTIILTLIPALLSLGAGVFVLIRRKYR